MVCIVIGEYCSFTWLLINAAGLGIKVQINNNSNILIFNILCGGRAV